MLGAVLMRSRGFVPVSAEISSKRRRPPRPPTDTTPTPLPIPRRTSILSLPGRPCHLIGILVCLRQIQSPEKDAQAIPPGRAEISHTHKAETTATGSSATEERPGRRADSCIVGLSDRDDPKRSSYGVCLA